MRKAGLRINANHQATGLSLNMLLQGLRELLRERPQHLGTDSLALDPADGHDLHDAVREKQLVGVEQGVDVDRDQAYVDAMRRQARSPRHA